MMVELERSNDGFLKSFNIKVAEEAISLSKGRKERGQTYWKLPDDSIYRTDNEGLLVVKRKRKTKEEE